MKQIKTIGAAMIASLLIVGVSGSSTSAFSLIDLTIERLNTNIERLEKLQEKQAEKIAEVKAKVEKVQTKKEEAKVKAELKKLEAQQKKVETEQKIEEKKLEWKQSAEAKIDEKRLAAQQKLQGEKIEACENVVGKINRIIDETNTRRDATYALITDVVIAVEEYYQQTALVVENYEALLAAVETAQTASQVVIQRLDSAANFDCSNAEPYSYIAQYKANRYESKEALKIYRDSVNDLVVAVKDAAKASAKAVKDAGVR